MVSRMQEHRDVTLSLAYSLDFDEVYRWLLTSGYFPEAYVLPPCFNVRGIPKHRKRYYDPDNKFEGLKETEPIQVHFPKTELTDRTFSIIEPKIHHDIAYEVAYNWGEFVNVMVPVESIVFSYSFPVPIHNKQIGRMGVLRSGRMIYEYIAMTDNALVTEAYKYTHVMRTDIKNFYSSIYTHSIAWAFHTKKYIRRGNRQNYRLFGNRLDKLFQQANDGQTNGIPIGPAVSDIIAEVIASAVDCVFTKLIADAKVSCKAVRFKDDYRILVSNESDAKKVIKILQTALKEYSLELSDEKTVISALPDGLFRPWKSRYHLVYLEKKEQLEWEQFREIYLAVVRIDGELPGTGVIDRFLADITTQDGQLRMEINSSNLQKVVSMLLMLGTLRVKSFPKVIAILEQIVRTYNEVHLTQALVRHLRTYLDKLLEDEPRNRYLISWVAYFLVSNDLFDLESMESEVSDHIVKLSMGGQGELFKDMSDFKLIEDVKVSGQRVSMFKHLDFFNPPEFDIE